MAVVLPITAAPLSRLCSFARWLPKHAALDKSLRITAEPSEKTHGWPEKVDGLPLDLHHEAGLLLLEQAMQLAASRPAAGAATGATAAADAAAGVAVGQQQQQQQQQQGLRLASFSSNWCGAPGLLAALPAHSLTQLQLDLGWMPGDASPPYYRMNPAVASASLARLSSLQQLTLKNTVGMCQNPASCLAAVTQLSQLTLLDLRGLSGTEYRGSLWEHDDDDQPALLGLSQLRILRLPVVHEHWPALDFARMTQLQELTNDSSAGFDDDTDPGFSYSYFSTVQFPAQLKQLDFGPMTKPHQVASVAQLQQLQGLTFVFMLFRDEQQLPDMEQQLLPLAKLRAMQQLAIRFECARLAAAAATAFGHLRQLCDLTLRQTEEDGYHSKEQWEAIRGGLAATTSLTKLELLVRVRQGGRGYSTLAVEACSALAGLTRLKDLQMQSPLVPGDALALTALTGFTRLVLYHSGAGVGCEAAAAIARSCTQLQHLDLWHCSLGSAACLADIGRLTQLTTLQLAGNPSITLQGLMQLTGLVQLRELGVDKRGEVTPEAVESFKVALASSTMRQESEANFDRFVWCYDPHG